MNDVVVVGGGLSGLSCAEALVRAGKSVVVLEARDRVGGRTFSRKIGDGVFDLGGQWLAPSQKRVTALARRLRLETFPTHHEGDKVLCLGNERSTYKGTIPSLPVLSLIELQRALSMVDRIAAKVPVKDPSRAPDAATLDARSVEDWKQREILSPAVRTVLDVAIRVVFGAEPRDLSVLYFLSYLRAGGGLMSLVEIEGGAQERRFVEGAQGLSLGLARELGDRVVLNAPVRAIQQDDDGVTVVADRKYRARQVVVAVPPGLAGRIEYSPSLPVLRDQLAQRMPMGSTAKVIALYPRAFWRDRGLSGEAVLDSGPISVVFDNTSYDGKQPSLLGFVVGQEARVWSARPAAERRALALSVFARCFGEEAAHPSDFVEHDWSTEVWTRGCPVASMGPGAMLTCGAALRAPVGKLFWAGTETATEWTGYLEGAIEAGERAAREALDARGAAQVAPFC